MFDEKVYLEQFTGYENGGDGLGYAIMDFMESVGATIVMEPMITNQTAKIIRYNSDEFGDIKVVFDGKPLHAQILGEKDDKYIGIDIRERSDLHRMMITTATISTGNEIVAAKYLEGNAKTAICFYNSDSVEAAKSLTGKTGIDFSANMSIDKFKSLGIDHDKGMTSVLTSGEATFFDFTQFSKANLQLLGEKKTK